MINIDTSKLPTHLALVARRYNVCNPDDLAARFLEISYLAECILKTIACALHAGLEKPARELAYRHAYEFVRADGLGIWELSIRQLTTPPTASYLPPEFFPLLSWITKKRTQPDEVEFRAVFNGLRSVLSLLGNEQQDGARTPTIRDLLTLLVQIRNKTKAHGAVGEEFYAAANAPYFAAVASLAHSCPAFLWRWIYLTTRDSGKARGIALVGLSPKHIKDIETAELSFDTPGVCLVPDQSTRVFSCGSLLRTNRDCTAFLLPNGGMTQTGLAEFIDYGSGNLEKIALPELISPPVQRPPSETEGLSEFDIQSNVFGNLPPIPVSYVKREKLEGELLARLHDRNHPIITLHGGGGMGKTSLAIKVAHQIAASENPPFEHIVWFSARDVDLRPTGPAEVRQNVVDLKTVSHRFGELFSSYAVGNDAKALARALQSPVGISAKGMLFIFDNFETMSDVRGLHKFLDEHTHLPNKVLITSRDRAFVADYPIEVRGMEFSEAREMLINTARELFIEGLMTDDVIQRVYDFTGGHAYVMRVVAGEMAKDGRYTPPVKLMGRRDDIVDAVFERSFNKLSEAGRCVFLVVANWKSDVSELGLTVVLGVRGIDADAGIDECRRLSLILTAQSAITSRSYSIPQLARAFGQKKLQGDPDRLVIQEDLTTLRKFSASNTALHEADASKRLISQFVQSCMEDLNRPGGDIERAEKLLESLASVWPGAWLSLAEFREKAGRSNDSVSYALRRAVEEQPYSREAWIRRANFAEGIGDEAMRIACLVSAVEAAPTDLGLVREVAIQLTKYVHEHRAEIPKARRGVYLASVRSHMEKLVDQLDANSLSRLAWLYLLEENQGMGRKYAMRGCELDPNHTHCLRILANIDGGRASSPPH